MLGLVETVFIQHTLLYPSVPCTILPSPHGAVSVKPLIPVLQAAMPLLPFIIYNVFTEPMSVSGFACRAIIAADQVLVFEPKHPSSRRFLKIVVDKLAAYDRTRISRRISGFRAADTDEDVHHHPFELEMLEGALIVATGDQPPSSLVSSC